jgi:hypothetical protein
MTAPVRKRSSWLEHPLTRGQILALGVILLAVPVWLFADGFGWYYRFDPFRNFVLVLDDFPYLAACRTRPSLIAHLLTPHNAHVVPLFRIWTYFLCAAAGNLANLSVTLGSASYLPIVLVMGAGGVLVARETKSGAVGLAAMAGLGITTVMEPAATWFSASQAVWAGLFVLLTLLALQSWVTHRGRWRVVLALLCSIAAPMFWSGGYAAGPVGAFYLFASRERRSRQVEWILLATTLSIGSLFFIIGRSHRAARAVTFNLGPSNLLRGVGNSLQAIVEVLFLHNLGMDGATTAPQAAVLCVGLGLLWWLSRVGRGPVLPLEAAGAALVALSFGMVFTFRGEYAYESLRDYGWYHAIPQIGFVLFASGCWQAWAGSGAVRGILRSRRREGLVVIGLVIALCLLQLPRAQRLFMSRVPPRTLFERKQYPIPYLQRLRAIYLVSDRADRQRRGLARLDAAETAATRMHLSRGALRRALGSVGVPGWPEQVKDQDALDLLDLPDDGPDVDPSRLRGLQELLAPEPEQPPPWIPPGETWPPKPGKDDGGGPPREEEEAAWRSREASKASRVGESP